jgi:hypothetical protein
VLEKFAAKHFKSNAHLVLSPATRDVKVARKWFAGVGGALDGVIAKQHRHAVPVRQPHGHGEGQEAPHRRLRRGRVPLREQVEDGCRLTAPGPCTTKTACSIHVGFCSSFKTDERKKLAKMLEPLIKEPGFTGRAPGGPSRWSPERSGEWKPVAPKLVVEVRYDHFTNDRFRHGTAFLRWRPDKAPEAVHDEAGGAGERGESAQVPDGGTARDPTQERLSGIRGR